MDKHLKWMQRALDLAEKGRGFTSPNPMVGAVLIKNNTIIGEGYHAQFGDPHAEVMALGQAEGSAKGATLYVTLEPCSHQGKTPPCAPQLVGAGISDVYISMVDPNPRVNQNGIRLLKNAGIRVHTGLLEKEVRHLNRGYIRLIEEKRPWITLKLAQTADGYIADLSGKSQWITSPPAREYVIHQRSVHDGIMVGSGTVLKDNPTLLPEKKNAYIPRRIILDDMLRISEDMNLVTDKFRHRTLILTSSETNKEKMKHFSEKGVQLMHVPGNTHGGIDLSEALKALAEFGITSIYCEGGGQIAGTLIQEGLIDELQLFIAPKVLGKGLSTFGGFIKSLNEAIHLTWEETHMIGPDILIKGRPDGCLRD
jgi:diaminohydroxyphosphoribosylaminopyrimidine deaminase / 5-amino-6-(5-phosphoribosylamino)uracil reductase